MPKGSPTTGRHKLLTALSVAAALGAPLLILQRYVAATRYAAILLALAWFAVIGLGVLVWLRGRHELRWPALGTYFAVLLGAVAIGYWTGFRDVVVDEDIVVATARASAIERERALAPATGPPPRDSDRPAPVELARGEFDGADGHEGRGTATVVGQVGRRRVLTFTRFDVDPGVDVDVFLVSGDGSEVSDRIELGNLKGNVGDQQYEIPADADLTRYATVVLWCNPFTVRIAVAQLR